MKMCTFCYNFVYWPRIKYFEVYVCSLLELWLGIHPVPPDLIQGKFAPDEACIDPEGVM